MSSVPLHSCVVIRIAVDVFSAVVLLTGAMLPVPLCCQPSATASDLASHCVISSCAIAECTQWQAASVLYCMCPHHSLAFLV